MKSEDILALMNHIDDRLLIDCEARMNNMTAQKHLPKQLVLVASIGAAVILITASVLHFGDIPSNNTTGTEKTDRFDSTTTTSTTTVHLPDTPPVNSWALESYESLAVFWNNFRNTGDDDNDNYRQYGSDFITFVENIQNQNYLLIPAVQGTPAPLTLDDEYLDIMIATANDLKQPCIWYGCNISGEKITVKTTYLWDAQAQASKEMTASVFLETFYPVAPNLGTHEKYSDLTIYEEKVNYNGTEVDALFVEYDLDNKMEVYWLTDGLLVCVYMDKDGLASGWPEQFSFIEMPLSDA